MSKSAKGSTFEREFCSLLSEWWTNGERDDCFWRTGGSGARAKVRGRKGKGTYGQSGDVAATDPIGDPLIQLLTIELKRGYSRYSIADLLDKRGTSAKQEYEKWIEQAMESHIQARSKSWMIVTRRDCRDAIVILPFECFRWLVGPSSNGPCLRLFTKFGKESFEIIALPLELFFELIKPDVIKNMHQEFLKKAG